MLICGTPYHQRLRPVLYLLGLLLLIQIGSAVYAPLSFLLAMDNYVPLHTVLEMLSIVISALVFAAGWIVYEKEDAGNLMLLACGFLGVALLDVMHTMSYPGMPDWVSQNSPEKAIQFWLAARSLAAIALFAVAFLPDWPLNNLRTRWLMLTGVLSLVGLITVVVLSQPLWVPRTFLPGQGLTPFKKNFEYLLVLIYATMAWRFFRKSHSPHVLNVTGLFAAAAIMAMSEMFFTLYADVTDSFSLLGHIYKFIAYTLIYCSVFTNSIELPYQRLHQSKRAFQDSEAKFHAIIKESPVAYMLKAPDRRIRYLNPAFIETFGYCEADLPDWQSWWRQAFPDADYRQKCMDAWQLHVEVAHAQQRAVLPMEFDICCKNGGKRTVLINVAFLDNELAGHRVVILQDITERVEAMNVIWRQAHLDPLTELPNRNQFLDNLTQEMVKARRSGLRMALLFIDLDRFKDVNDTLGHFMGDVLLREAAQRLREAIERPLTLARLGGDEFTVIVTDLQARADVNPIAQQILHCLAEPFVLDEEMVYLSASIGVAFYPDDADNAEVLLKNADQAMYEAKKLGRDRYSLFTDQMQRQAQNRMRLLGELHGALSKQQLQVVYQPIVELATQTVCKAEALLRWQHPTLGMVSPVEFIPLAEETGVIVEIGEWVFRTAAEQVKHWRQSYLPEFQVSINKSPVQFCNERYDQTHWLNQLEQLGLPGQSIVVEITEGLLLDARELVSRQLLIFRDAGIQVALDDFGTGYSSLAYLKKFDIDYLKIDRSFVSHLQADSSDLALCEAIIVMAHKLGIKVIAEGIETAEQYALLVKAGCDYGQGYLFSRPVSAEAFNVLLESPASWRIVS
ncbi:bifunctional diguanylate cyclase/phosphodiesterase [Methylomonas rapida]|uniref:EAL domain-containing protein n=1 Tax=Methylomonas rapida TaxID=2963939 RepID=A0ABY7GQI7_9GAMM|nr:EAL domain-containing protein [Methylomonas rapida]WAR46769.1 EAL domain-containing protein [Methylomonas rapida]